MLKKGDLVVMHTCMEADNPKNEGKIWTCKSDEFKHHPSHDYTVIMLEGFSGSFATKYLQKVNLDFSYKEFLEKDSNYSYLVRDNAELIHFKDCAEKVLTEDELEVVYEKMQEGPEVI